MFANIKKKKSMKKTPSIVLAMCLTSFFLFSCGGKKEETKTEGTEMSTEKASESNSGSEAKTSEDSKSEDKTSSNNKCDQFLADYEAFINDYLEMAKKLKENPQDMSVMTEYSQMTAKASKWAADAKDCSADAAFAAKYAQLAARMAQKAGSM